MEEERVTYSHYLNRRIENSCESVSHFDYKKRIDKCLNDIINSFFCFCFALFSLKTRTHLYREKRIVGKRFERDFGASQVLDKQYWLDIPLLEEKIQFSSLQNEKKAKSKEA
jgi:hypothetical protein